MDQTTAKEIRELVKLTTADHKKYALEERIDPMTGAKGYTPESIDSVQNPKVLEEIESDFNKTHTTLMKDAATKLDDDKKVTPFNLDTIVKMKDMRE